MGPSLRTHVEAVLPELGPSLVPAHARTRVLAVAEKLPPLSLGGVECRLGPHESQVDLQVHLPRLRSADTVRDAFRGAPIGEDAFHRWLTAAPEIAKTLPGVWLEYDLVGGAEGRGTTSGGEPLPNPSLFFEVEGEAGCPRGLAGPATIVQRLGLAEGRLLGPFTEVLSALPIDSLVTHVGVMSGRPDRAVCLRVTALSLDHVTGLCRDFVALDRAGEEEVSDLLSRVDSVTVLLSLGEDRARIGIECFLRQPPAQADGGWTALLAHLGQHGLCTAEKAREMALWPGVQRAAPSRERLETPGPAPLPGLSLPGYIRRSVNHMKVVVSERGPTMAKAYLCFRHLWLRA